MGKASKKNRAAAHKGTDNVNVQSAAALQLPREGVLHKPATHLLVITVLGFLAYCNTFHGPFQWDEAEYILNNPVIRDLGYFISPSRVEGSWLYGILKSRYIGYLTFALNYKLHGYSVFGYHVVNLAIHLGNAILVYLLVLLTLRTPGMVGPRSSAGAQLSGDYSLFTVDGSRFLALAVALLFVAHPVQTEAVTYVFQRLASLVSMFYLLSLLLYVKGRLLQTKNKVEGGIGAGKYSALTWTCFSLSLLSAVLAMKTKENAFTLPVVMTLYEFLFFSGPLKGRVLRLAPFLLTLLIIPVTIFGTGSTAGELIGQIRDPQSLGYQELAWEDYLFTQFRVMVTYLRLLVFPMDQNIDYDYPIYRTFFTPPVFLSFLFLASIVGTAIYFLYRARGTDRRSVLQTQAHREDDPLFTVHLSRLIAFGILWFFITLSVESSVIAIPMVINEYRVYLPSVGFFLAATGGGLLLLRKFPADHVKKGKAAAAAFLVIVLALASTTYARNTLWKDKVSLWEDVIRKSPNSSRGYNNLGIAYFDKRQYDKAIAMYERCLALRPTQRDAHVNLGVVYAAVGRLDKAIDHFLQAVDIEPGNNTAYFNLARAYTDAGRPDKAAEVYAKTIELNPYNSAAYHGLGTSNMKLGRFDDALAAYTKFVSLSPYDPEAYRNRGIAYGQKGDMMNARADFQKSCSLGRAESCEYLKDPKLR